MCFAGYQPKFAPGEFVSIMGASGAGKSTLLHTMGGLDKPTSGRVLLNDEDIYAVSATRLNQLRSSVFGFVFQAFHLLPELDVLENVILPAMSRRGAWDAGTRFTSAAASS